MWRNIIVLISFSLLVTACGTLGKAAGPDFVAPTPTTANWQTYTSAEGKFSIAFPPDYTLYQNQVPSIDGVLAEVPNSIALQRSAEPGFVLSIIYRPTDGTLSAAELAALDDTCVAGTPGQSLALGGQTFQTLMFKDTSCGPHGSTLIYVNSGALGYRIAIEALAGYQSVVADVNPILDTLLFRVSDESLETAPFIPDPGSSTQQSPDAADDSAAIEQAMLDALRAQGAPTENARIEVQKIADGYARVAVYYDVVARPDFWDLGFAYAEQGAWKAWAFGSGIAQEHVEAAGIPRSVWPDGWLTASP